MKISRSKIVGIAAVLIVLITAFAVAGIINKGGIGNLFKGNMKQQPDTNNTVTSEPSAEGTGGKGNTVPSAESSTESIPEVEDKSGDESGNGLERIQGIKVRAVYLSGPSAGKSSIIDNIIRLSNTTELNAVVIDIKESGVVNYESGVPEVKKNALFIKYYDPESLIKKLHENNIYVIGRIVCFMDSGLGTKRIDLAIKKTTGEPWKEGKWGTWVNPYNDEVLAYNIDIAKEAADKGFDEIQFDYVRFPSGTGTRVDYGSNVPQKADVICKFLETARKELYEKKGVSISADVFGIICIDPNTKDSIGQDLEKVGLYLDYICPMVYPSHYANASTTHYTGNGIGQNINGVSFTAPDLEPYKVVYNSLMVAKNRTSKVEGYKARFRPNLQSFTAAYLPNGYYQKYGAKQVRQQIQAVYDAGYDEWILWNSANVYSDDIFEKKPAP